MKKKNTNSKEIEIYRESDLSILNHLKDPLHVIDKDLNIRFLNPEMILWLGKLNLNSNILGKTIFEAFPFLEYDKITEEYNKVFKTGELVSTKEKITLITGIVFTEILKIPVKVDGGVNLIITIIRDITEYKESEEKLRASEEWHKNIIKNIMDVIVVLDLKGNFLYVSPQIYNISGFKQEELISKSGFKFMHPEDIKKAADVLKEAINKKNKMYIEYRTRHKDGHYIDVSASGRIVNIKGEDRIFAVVRDISQRIAYEQDLIESEKKYRQLIENSLEGVWVIDEDARTTLVNPSMSRILGYEVDEMIGRSLFDFTLQEDIETTKNTLERRSKGIKEEFEKKFIRKDGKEVITRLMTSPIFNNDGKYIGAIAFVSDITERIRAEQNLKESEEKFRMIAEHSYMGILITVGDKIEYVNNALLHIFEYSNEEIANWTRNNIIRIIYPDDLQLLREYRKKLREGDPNVKPYFSYRVFTKSGKLKWVDQFSTVIKYMGKPAELATIVDITEKKVAEQELVKLDSLKSELMRRTSHELKTPLVSIKGYSDLLLNVHKEKLDDYVLASIVEIKQGCERLESLIQDILNTAELESGIIQIDKIVDDLAFFIKLSVRELRGLAKLRNHTINLIIPDKLITSFEPEQIHQVISNLINNAIKYTPPNGIIEILSEINENFIIISIKDNGIGLTNEEKERIFTQFGKIERYGQGLDIITNGSGLGLYISKKIVELHGGKIWVESEGRNKGSTFNFTLPIIIESND
jgi:PAS domain S-box-containing protein